jgi:hypothetical protein
MVVDKTISDQITVDKIIVNKMTVVKGQFYLGKRH